MIFCYLDESGTPETPGTSSHYVLAGLAIPVYKWRQCEIEIHTIKSKYGIENAEIHTAWILRPYLEQVKIQGFERMDWKARKYESEKYRNRELLRCQSQGNPSKYKQTKKNYLSTSAYVHLTFSERQALIFEIANLIGSWGFGRLFADCIDKLHFNPAVTSLTIDEEAFMQVVSRFEQYLKIFSSTSRNKQFGLLIHDNNDTTKLRHTELMKSFHQKGTLWTAITNIIETPMFVDSQLTSMVQIADLCSYSLRRYVEKGERPLFDQIFRIADRKDGRVVGVRHFAHSSCNCEVCLAHR